MKQRYLLLTICLTAVALTGVYFGSQMVGERNHDEDVGGVDDQSIPNLTLEHTTKSRHRVTGPQAHVELPVGTVLTYGMSYGGRIGTQQYQLVGNFQLAVMTASIPQVAWVRIKAANAPDALTPILADISRGTYVQLATDGFGFTVADAATLAKLDLAPDHQSEAHKEFWRGLGQRLSVRFPVDHRSDYLGEESKNGVMVEATYRFHGHCSGAHPEPFAFEKIWQSQVESAAVAVSGDAKGEFRAGCRGLERLALKETETVTAASERLVGVTELNLKLQEEGHHSLAAIKREFVQLASADHQLRDNAPSSESAIDTAQVGDLDESQLLATLRQQGGREQLTQEQYLQLKSWIALHPDSIARIRLALAADLGGDPDADPRMRAFVKALGAVGSQLAQDTLVAMAKDHAGDPDFAARIVTTLGFVANPSVGATEALISYAETSSDKALMQRAKMASGIMGSRLRQSTTAVDQSRAVDLEATIDGWLARAQSDSERYDALAALGNLGPSNIAPIMKLISDQSSTAVRDEAYFALRFAPDTAVVDFLQRSFVSAGGSNAANVRAAVVRTLAARPVDEAWYRVVSDLADRPMAPGDAMALAEAVVRSQDSGNRDHAKVVLDRLTQRTSDTATQEQLTELRRRLSH